MSKVTGFTQYISENSLYTTQAEKNDFVANERAVMDSFFYSFIGWVSLLSTTKNPTKIKAYFRKDKKLRLNTIDDTNNDTSLIIKIMAEGGYFKTALTPTQITRFLVKARQGEIDDVDPNILRGWINEIKPAKYMRASPKVRKHIEEFMAGGTLGKMARNVRYIARKDKTYRASELVTLTQGIKIDQTAGATPGMSPSAASATTTKSTTTQSEPSTDTTKQAAKTTPAAKQAAPAQKKYESVTALWQEFKDGKTAADIAKEYKLTKTDLNNFMQELYARINSIEFLSLEDQIRETTKFFTMRKDDISQVALRKVIFAKNRSGKVESLASLKDAFFKVTTSGLINLYTDTPDAGELKAIHMIIDLEAETIAEKNSIDKLEASIKNFKDLYMKSPLFIAANVKNKSGYFSAVYGKTPNGYMRNVAMVAAILIMDDPLPVWETMNIIVKSGDGYFFRSTSLSGQRGYQGLPAPLIEYAKKLGVKTQGNYEKVLEQLEKGTDAYRGVSQFPWQNGDALDGVDLDQLKTDLKKAAQYGGNFQDYLRSMLRVRDDLHPNNMPLIDWMIDSYDVSANGLMYYSKSSYSMDYVRVKMAERVIQWLAANAPNMVADRSSSSSFGSSAVNRNGQTLHDIYKTLEGAGLLDKYKQDIIKVASKNIADIVDYTLRASDWYGASRYQEFNKLKFNEILSLFSQKDHDKKDNFLLSVGLKYKIESLLRSSPISPYSSMSAENKALYKKYMSSNLSGVNVFQIPGADLKYFDELSDDEFVNTFAQEPMFITYLRDLEKEEQVALFDRLVSNERGQQAFLANQKMPESDYMDIITSSTKLDDKIFSQYVQGFLNKIDEGRFGRGKDVYAWSKLNHLVAKSSNVEDMTSKAAILLEKSLAGWDTNGISKRTRQYQSFMTDAQSAFVKYTAKDRKAADALYKTLSPSMQRRLAGQYLANKEFALSAGAAIVAENQPIRPFEKLNDKRIRDILKYNNVVSEETKVPAKHIKSLDTLDAYAETNLKDVKPIDDLQIEEVKMPKKELLQLTVRMHQTRRSGRHGTSGLLFNKAFDVKIPLQIEAQKKWISDQPDQEIINPMYHGTGSIAASMILRYGFRVIKSGDSSVVGRMLGDGVYGAIHIDKSQQYIGDSGYSRGIGNKGYLFEMNAALGKQREDYRVAGLGRDNIRSPEWCVFTPNSQFLILRAYEVQIIADSTMNNIIAENPLTTAENRDIMKFKSFITEQNDMGRNYKTYTFVNGLIPISTDDYVDFADFKPERKNITLEPSAYGPTVVIEGTETSEDYIFTGPTDFQVNNEELFEEYIKLLNGG